MRKKYERLRASRKKTGATVVRQENGVQIVSVPVERLFSPDRDLRGAWERQTDEKAHAKAAKTAARAQRKKDTPRYTRERVNISGDLTKGH